ncbi:MAG: PIN domain-containing protein [Methylococcales bacterium]|nr:PIN domain-containing protein [Methylococcales bacterium]
MNIQQDSCNDEIIKILLIDLENCPCQIHQLQNDIEEYTQVIICYAKTGVKIPLDWLESLSSAVNKNKLKIFKMAHVGKNSADFGICFFAGALMQEFQNKAHFVIISNDLDLDHVVSLLISQGCTAERVGLIKEKNNLPLVAIHSYCKYLMTNNINRPSKEETLLNSIKSILKNHQESPEVVFKFLIKHKVIVIKENKVIYNDNKIAEIVYH